METKTVNGVEVPALGLGTWKMEGQECADAVARALNMGYRHVDTAQMYRNEEAVGQGIAASDVDRDKVFLTTKVWRTELAHDDVLETARESLDRLDTEYVDLLLIHWPNQDVPLEETLDAMQELKAENLVRNVGVSNFTTGLLSDALDVEPRLLTNQVEMHPFHQQREMRRFCVDHEMLLTAYSPLARGRVLDHPVIEDIARECGKTPAQVTLRWLVQQPNVVPIPKAIPEDLQRENLAALEFELDVDDMQRIFDIDHRSKYVNPDFAPW